MLDGDVAGKDADGTGIFLGGAANGRTVVRCAVVQRQRAVSLQGQFGAFGHANQRVADILLVNLCSSAAGQRTAAGERDGGRAALYVDQAFARFIGERQVIENKGNTCPPPADFTVTVCVCDVPVMRRPSAAMLWEEPPCSTTLSVTMMSPSPMSRLRGSPAAGVTGTR